ncbi:MAG: pirin family protein [Chloroflexi bacterium]|nr:pirin family protein [Chloroflexota bacterium]
MEHLAPPQLRRPERVLQPQPVVEGAGVRLRHSIATRELDYLDPFLLLDDFRSDTPADFLAGFPMHPHRGIETVTYVLGGEIQHRDSLGNAGFIGAGDVQWMTAGRGILHEEMPQQAEGFLSGFQLWVNLPARLKMIRPRYQEVPSAVIPTVRQASGATVQVIAGEVDGVRGPVTEIASEPIYLDVQVAPDGSFQQPLPASHNAFVYLFQGGGSLGDSEEPLPATRLVVLGPGHRVRAQAGQVGMRFLLVAGQPLGEPIARYGPFVMNTRAEIEQTLQELRAGTFIRSDEG